MRKTSLVLMGAATGVSLTFFLTLAPIALGENAKPKAVAEPCCAEVEPPMEKPVCVWKLVVPPVERVAVTEVVGPKKPPEFAAAPDRLVLVAAVTPKAEPGPRVTAPDCEATCEEAVEPATSTADATPAVASTARAAAAARSLRMVYFPYVNWGCPNRGGPPAHAN